MNPKLTPEHLGRDAIVLARQSTMGHGHGAHREPATAVRARGLSEDHRLAAVTTIDDDLGRSVSGVVDRPGLQRLVAKGLHMYGRAVFCIEASRLARNGRDWHRLIDLCALVGTVIVDPDGVYDPRLTNDRLFLSLKGTTSDKSSVFHDSVGSRLATRKQRAENCDLRSLWATAGTNSVASRKIPTIGFATP
jgi:DNA invertase Pin-like site-specific DNA recombinase